MCYRYPDSNVGSIPGAFIEAGITEFLSIALDKGWIVLGQR